MNPWQVLGIEPIEDPRAIKQAYARAVKQHRPDSDPEGYQRVRECYEWALGWVEWRQAQALDPGAQEPRASEPAPEPTPAVDVEADAGHLAAAQVEAAPAPAPAIEPAPEPHAAAPAAQASDGQGEKRSDAAPVPIPDSEPEQAPGPIEIVEPAPLLASLHHFWTQQGDAALIDALPRLLFALNEVPLAYQAEASHRFAAWLVENPVPEEVAAVLQRHFGWRSDYRVDGQLGPELVEALRAKLSELGLDGAPGTRAATQRVLFSELRRLVEQRRHWRARWRLLREPGRAVLRLSQELDQLTL
ncbi:MAG: J domain-containing protein, partial [Aquimonas sp.]